MPLHSIAKSALKPIFSPLPHPTFFAPKSPFFPFFPVLSPFSDDFSMARSRFLPCEAHFFLVFPRFGPTSDDFSRDLTLYFPCTPLFAQRKYFSDSGFPFLHPLPHLHISIDFLSALHSPPPSSLLPHFLSHSSPLFHLPPQLTHERAHPRAIRAYAYARTYPHVRRFSFIAFTASPTLRNPLCTNVLGVKKNEKKPSQNSQSIH